MIEVWWHRPDLPIHLLFPLVVLQQLINVLQNTANILMHRGLAPESWKLYVTVVGGKTYNQFVDPMAPI